MFSQRAGASRLVALLIALFGRLAAAPGDVEAFNPNAGLGSTVRAVAIQPDGKLLVGGTFTTIGNTSRNRFARLNSNGSLDSAFSADADGAVSAIIVLGDGQMLVGGGFNTIGTSSRARLARLSASGVVDPNFDPGTNGSVAGLVLQPDGKIIVGGAFSTIAGNPRNNLARLNSDGSIDASFNPNVIGAITTVALQADGKIVFGGGVTSVGGMTRSSLARVNADGSLDAGFSPTFVGNIESVAVQVDGKIVVGGNNFTTVNGVARSRLARLEANGTLDAAFNPGAAGGGVYTLIFQTDSKTIYGGTFTATAGNSRKGFARLNVDATLDSTFTVSTDFSVFGVALDAAGKLILAGDFSQLGTAFRNRLARLENDPIAQSLTAPDAATLQWLRGGSAPETYHVTFERSTDGGTTWLPLGTGMRISGGWTIGGLSLQGNFQIRARARTLGGMGNGSSGLVEKIEVFALPAPDIEVAGGTPLTVIANGDVSPGSSDGTQFGTVAVSGNANASRTYTIRNLGNGPLAVSNVVSGNAGEFSVGGFTPGTIAANGSATFTVTFDPSAAGLRASTITIASDDAADPAYTFAVEGNGLASPEIEVRAGSPAQVIVHNDLVPGGTDDTDFGHVALTAGPGAARIFTIHNLGDADLAVTAVTSSNTVEFIVDTFTPGIVAPGGTKTFSIAFDPNALNLRTSDISIANDDADEAPYVFRVQGNGAAPDLAVRGLSVTIADGDTTPTGNDDTDFGNVLVCSSPSSATHTFTVHNLGTAPLTLTGAPVVVVGGVNPGDFVITQQPQLTTINGPTGQTTFTVTFNPTAAGLRTATLSIANSQSSVNPYDFAIAGNGIGPEINITGGGNVGIPDGSPTPVVGNGTDFAIVSVNTASTPHTFTITNNGTAPLSLIGTPTVELSGPHAGDFAIVQQPASTTLALGASTTFTVTFSPTAAGVRTAMLTISNDDCDEDVYNFALKGEGGATPEIAVAGAGNPVVDGSTVSATANATDFGSVLANVASQTHTFTVTNTGLAPLTLGLVSSSSSQFIVTQPIPTTVNANGGTATFQVKFQPTVAAVHSATISIVNDDGDENPFDFVVRGTGVTAPEIEVQDAVSLTTIAHNDLQPSFADRTDFGNFPVSGGFMGPRYFNIWNRGNAPLSITAIASTVPSEFYVIPGPLPATVPAGGMIFFSVFFDPTGPGLRTANIEITNTDADEPLYTYAVQGNGSGDPEINVTGQGITIVTSDPLPAVSDGTDFGGVPWNGGAFVDRTFTIHNGGAVPLNLTGAPLPVVVSGPQAGEFTVTQPVVTSISVGQATTFTVRFDPAGVGLRSATLTIPNDDFDENPYVFGIQGTGEPVPKPNISVIGNNLPILDNDTSPTVVDLTDVGGTLWNGSATITRAFGVLNPGDATLTMTPIAFSGPNAADFSVVLQPPATLPALGAAPFTIVFNPSGPGLRSATLAIGTNVPGKNPFNFAVQGTGYNWAQWVPDMQVLGNSLAIADGDGTPLSADHTHFGSTSVSGGIVTRTFTIKNDGPAPLSLTGTPFVSVSGLHASNFTVIQPTSGSVPAGGSVSFNVLFNPSAAGTRNATLSIPNNDPLKHPYNFALRGTGLHWLYGGGSGWVWINSTVRWVPAADVAAGTQRMEPLGDSDSSFGQPRSFGWGQNNLGQLGVSETTLRAAPAAVDTSGVLAGKAIVDLAAGQNHSVALCADGTLAAWGQGTLGQLGHGVTADSLVPVAVDLSGALAGKTVVALAAGRHHTLALCSDNTIVAWGQNDAGQLGDGSTSLRSVPVVVAATAALAGKTVIAVAAGDQHSVALCADGTVVTWGDNTFGQLGNGTPASSAVPVSIVTGVSSALSGRTVVAIAAGASHTLVACADGRVGAWGRNNAGQLGDGTTTDRSAAVVLGASGLLAGKTIVAIAGGAAHSLALCSDDTLLAWGDNTQGQLGNNSTTSSSMPVAVTRAGALAGRTPIAIAAGAMHNVVVNADGSGAAWGDNAHGQLGTNTTISSSVPVTVTPGAVAPGSSVHRIVAGPTASRTLLIAAAPAPLIALSGRGVPILAGSSPGSAIDGTDFGRVALGEVGAQTFTLANRGSVPLSLTGSPKVTVGGAHAADFVVADQPASPVAPHGGVTTFTIRFTPGGAGERTATLTVASDDPAHNPFTFEIRGIGTTAGALDPRVSVGINNAVQTTAVQPDGKLLIGGSFTALNPGGATPQRIARVSANGLLDTGFSANADALVGAIAVQMDGAIILGGSFSTIGGESRQRLARIDANGAVDAAFAPVVNAPVNAIAIQPDGKLIVAGDFTSINGVTRNKVARLAPDGSLEAAFDPNVNRAVYAVAVQPDGKILLGGNFDQVAGVVRNRLARLNADGSLDAAFDPAPTSDVTSILVQPDNRIVIAGQFGAVAGVTRNRLARLNADGSLDADFNPNADSAVYTMTAQADGKIIIGGAFTTIGGVERIRLARLNANGTLDASFTSAADDVVRSVALQADGKVVVSGYFTSVGGTSRPFLARLDNDPALQSLSVASASRVQWQRGGATPEASQVIFERSLDGGGSWTLLGAGSRAAMGGWELTGLSLAGEGVIRARARTIGGGYSSSPGVVEAIVSFSLSAAPTIVTPPVAQTAVEGGIATFAVAVTGTPAPTYQWSKVSVAGSTPIAGATQATLTLGPLHPANAGGYQVTVSNEAGSVTSTPVMLTVTSAVVAPMIVVQPASRSTVAGASVLFAVTALGAPIPTYQWRKGNTPIPGATSATLTFAGVATADAGSYEVVVTNSAGSITSDPAILTVGIPPAITTQPASRGIGVGTGTVFSVTASGTVPLAYQWTKDGQILAGATASTLPISMATLDAAGVYRVTVSNLAGSVQSDPARLMVLDALPTHQVVGRGYVAGGTVTIANTLTYDNATSGLAWSALIPEGWSFAGNAGNVGDVTPGVGATGLLEWVWHGIPASPLSFTYTLNVPAGASGPKQLAALLLVRAGTPASVAQILAKPDPLEILPNGLHDADTDQDSRINLFELTRVIELYNTRRATERTGCYQVQAATEDGFASDPTREALAPVTLTRYHSADTRGANGAMPRDGRIDLVELTRVIALYNYREGTSRSGQYHLQAGTEDGFAPGP